MSAWIAVVAGDLYLANGGTESHEVLGPLVLCYVAANALLYVILSRE